MTGYHTHIRRRWEWTRPYYKSANQMFSRDLSLIHLSIIIQTNEIFCSTILSSLFLHWQDRIFAWTLNMAIEIKSGIFDVIIKINLVAYVRVDVYILCVCAIGLCTQLARWSSRSRKKKHDSAGNKWMKMKLIGHSTLIFFCGSRLFYCSQLQFPISEWCPCL